MRHYWYPHICWYRNHHNFFLIDARILLVETSWLLGIMLSILSPIPHRPSAWSKAALVKRPRPVRESQVLTSTKFEREERSWENLLRYPLVVKRGWLDNSQTKWRFQWENQYIYIYRWGIFHCHVWLPEGSNIYQQELGIWTNMNQQHLGEKFTNKLVEVGS